MARSRLDLQTLLESLTESVYFQPPTNIQMQYPCIIYARDGTSVDHANNELYRHVKRYMVTVVDRDPDSEIFGRVEALDYVNFERSYAADDLNHHVFTLFF